MQYASTKSAHLNKRRIIHRNEKQILSIIFDEMNCTDENFSNIRKTIKVVPHHFMYHVNNPACEIFGKLS